MLSRSLGMPIRNNRPPSIGDTHGISGNVSCKSNGVLFSALYPQESNLWVSNVSEHTSPHVMSESHTPVQDQRCQSRQSARNSFIPSDGRLSKNYAADQRLQISDLHFDKFPTPATFACWKIRFKTEVNTCASAFPLPATHDLHQAWYGQWSTSCRALSAAVGIPGTNNGTTLPPPPDAVAASHLGESILSAFTGRHSCPFNGTYSKALPDPFPDKFGCCTSTSISNFPPRRMKLITSPVLRCSTQQPSAVKTASSGFRTGTTWAFKIRSNPPTLTTYRLRPWPTSVGPFLSPGPKYFTPRRLSSDSSVGVSGASSGGQTVISAPESIPTEINFELVVTAPLSTCGSHSTALNSTVSTTDSSELSSSNLSSASCFSSAAMSLFRFLAVNSPSAGADVDDDGVDLAIAACSALSLRHSDRLWPLIPQCWHFTTCPP